MWKTFDVLYESQEERHMELFAKLKHWADEITPKQIVRAALHKRFTIELALTC